MSAHRHAPLLVHWRRHRPRYAGEFVGTYLIVLVATGVVVGNTVANGAITHVGIASATGLIVTAMIYSRGHLTSAHFNPAVSLAFAVGRHFPVRGLGPYWLAQLLGAVLASLSVRAIWGDAGTLGATLAGLATGWALVSGAWQAVDLRARHRPGGHAWRAHL